MDMVYIMMNNIFKVLKMVIVNILIICFLLFCLDYLICKFLYQRLECEYNNYADMPQNTPYRFEKFRTYYDGNSEFFSDIRQPVGIDYKSNSIIIFGCSFGYGYLLDIEDTFQYKISKLTKRPVYNYSTPGHSPQFALMRIQSGEIDEIIKNSDYLIYVTIGEHAARIHSHSNGYPENYVWPRYDRKLKNGQYELVFHEQRFPFIESSYIYKYLRKVFFAKILMPSKNNFFQDYLFDYMKLHFVTIQKELKKRNPNIKMIVLVYPDGDETKYITESKRWSELEKEGIMVININNDIPVILTSDEYIILNDGHPSAKAWAKVEKYFEEKNIIK